jgi:hypothetical protein
VKFMQIGRTRWVNVEQIASITAMAGASLVRVTTGETITDARSPETLMADLDALLNPLRPGEYGYDLTSQ